MYKKTNEHYQHHSSALRQLSQPLVGSSLASDYLGSISEIEPAVLQMFGHWWFKNMWVVLVWKLLKYQIMSEYYISSYMIVW